MTKEEALAEIARLQKIVDDLDKPTPQPLDNPNWEKIREIAIDEVSEIALGIHHDEDTDHWFYEKVMETVYGTEIWKWINEKSIRL